MQKRKREREKERNFFSIQNQSNLTFLIIILERCFFFLLIRLPVRVVVDSVTQLLLLFLFCCWYSFSLLFKLFVCKLNIKYCLLRAMKWLDESPFIEHTKCARCMERISLDYIIVLYRMSIRSHKNIMPCNVEMSIKYFMSPSFRAP